MKMITFAALAGIFGMTVATQAIAEMKDMKPMDHKMEQGMQNTKPMDHKMNNGMKDDKVMDHKMNKSMKDGKPMKPKMD